MTAASADSPIEAAAVDVPLPRYVCYLLPSDATTWVLQAEGHEPLGFSARTYDTLDDCLEAIAALRAALARSRQVLTVAVDSWTITVAGNPSACSHPGRPIPDPAEAAEQFRAAARRALVDTRLRRPRASGLDDRLRARQPGGPAAPARPECP